MMLTSLANWLRDAGLRVEEVAGWQSRGRPTEFNPGGWVWHHTAGSPNGRAPSLSTCLYGIARVPGPLCNILQTREPDGKDVFIVLAAGTANHAGSGGWSGLRGNHRVVGLEIEHTGIEHYPENRAALSQRAAAAVLKGLGHSDASMACQHFEWSTAGKIDVAQGVDPNEWRRCTSEFILGSVMASTDEGKEMKLVLATSDAFWAKNGHYWVIGPGSAAFRVGEGQHYTQILKDWAALGTPLALPGEVVDRYITIGVQNYVRDLRLDALLKKSNV